MHDGTGLRRQLDGEVPAHPERDLVVERHGAGAVPHPVELHEAAPQRLLVVPTEQHGAADVLARVTVGRRRCGRRPCHRGREPPEPGSLRRDPLLEFRRRVGHEDAVQEVAVVPAQRRRRIAALEGRLQAERVPVDRAGGDTDLSLAPGHNDPVAEAPTQRVEGLSEGAPGMDFVDVGPEQAQDAVAPPEAPGRRGREVGEQDQTLELQRDGTSWSIADAAQFQSAKRAQFQHPMGLHPSRRVRYRASDGEVTAG